MRVFKSLSITLLILVLTALCVTAQKYAGPKYVGMVTDRLPEPKVKPASDLPDESELPDPCAPQNSTQIIAGIPCASDQLITAATYNFAALGSVPLEDMSSGTTQLIVPANDDGNSTLQNIGFTFRFDGVNHTQFGVNANGFLSLGIAPTGTSFTNGIATTANQPKLMAFWDDLCTGTTGQVHFKTIGSPGTRKMIVEWQNMKITRNGSCVAPVGNGTFQLWLFEGSGVVQFVYGAGTPATTADGGYSIGLQAASATNFASVTTNGNTVSYAAANNTQMDAIPAGTSYTFSPSVPAAPSGVNFTGVTAATITVNWTDNSSNETGFIVSRSTDGINFTDIAATAANATSFADTGLTPLTNYTYRITAITEGAFSAPATGSQTTPAAGNITANAVAGNWSVPGTWAGGVVPNAGDNVTIPDGATVTIDTDAACLSLKVGNDAPLAGGPDKSDESKADSASPEGSNATLQFESANARTLAVGGNVGIGASDVFRSNPSGSVTTHVLSLGGNLTNNGSLDFSTNANSAGAGIVFTGAQNNTFGGSGAVNDVRSITVNKGTSGANILELSLGQFTVQGSTTDTAGSGYLTLTNGTFKISGTFTGTHRTFSTASYTIPVTGGFWLNNVGYQVAAQNGSATVGGLFRMTNGVYNVGTAADNSVVFNNGSTVIVEGGAIQVTGRFGVGVPLTNILNYTQSGGFITACKVGNTSTTLACFDLGTSTAATVVYSITAGQIEVQQASTAATGPRDYRLQSGATGTGTLNVPGGAIRFGNGSTTGGSQNFAGAGVFPNFELDGSAAAHTFTMLAPVTWNNLTKSMSIEAGTFNIGNNVFLLNGGQLSNNGQFIANGAASNFVPFDPTIACNITGSGTWGTIFTNIGVQSLVMKMQQTNQLRVRNLRIFTGNVQFADKLTLGNNDATVSVVQFGNTTTPTLAGTIDIPMVFDLGTGGETVTYLRTGNTRVTGPEINPARTLVSLTYDNNDPATDDLFIAGGDLTVSGALFLTSGQVNTSTNTLTHNGAVTRVAGFVNGTLGRSYAATGSYTYHVGAGGNYSPVAATVTTLATNPSSLSVRPNDSSLNGLEPTTAVSQYWTLAEIGDLTANLTFTYNNADINGDENGYLLWKSFPPVQAAGAVMTPGSNTAAAAGVTDFNGSWGIGTSVVPFGPSTISGTVKLASGRPIANASVVLQGGSLPQPLVAVTGQLGVFVFTNIPAGATYTISVSSKRYTFAPTAFPIELTGDATFDFVAIEELRGTP